MKDYDLIVIGTGAGMNVAARARENSLRVAIVEDGPLGGTCLNRGCIPSKILIEPANIVREIEDAERIGVFAKVERMDFQLVRKRMWEMVLHDRQSMERGVAQDEGIDFFHVLGRFVGPKVLQAGDEQVTAPKIVIACGVRTAVPEVPGLEEAGYLTHETVFDVQGTPKRLIILGGGYKACEFAHFFTAFGTEVTIIGHNPVLLPREEPEVSELMLRKMSELCDVKVNQEVTGVVKEGSAKSVLFRDRATGQTGRAEADEILVTTGVRSNADRLQVSATGVATDAKGYIAVNEYLETNVPGIWALGDIIGRNMFRHTANYESDVVWYNAFGKAKVKLDEHAVPHAVFAYPEVGSVGMTEAEAKQKGIRYFVGRSRYIDCAKGFAMGEEDGFVKVLIDARTGRIIGGHVAGPHASILIQPLVYLMNAGDQTLNPLARSQTIHPALSECVVNAFGNLSDPEHHHEHHE